MSGSQHVAVENLGRLCTHFLSTRNFDASSLGRSEEEFGALLQLVSELPGSDPLGTWAACWVTSHLRDVWAPIRSPRHMCLTDPNQPTLPLLRMHLVAMPAKQAEASAGLVQVWVLLVSFRGLGVMTWFWVVFKSPLRVAPARGLSANQSLPIV